MSSHSSHHPQEVLLAQFSLYVHKGSLKPDSFHFISSCCAEQLSGFGCETFPKEEALTLARFTSHLTYLKTNSYLSFVKHHYSGQLYSGTGIPKDVLSIKSSVPTYNIPSGPCDKPGCVTWELTGSIQRSPTLAQHCINVIQMFFVCWDVALYIKLSSTTWLSLSVVEVHVIAEL